MKLKFFTFASLAFFFASCSMPGIDSGPSKIVGEWEWVRTSGGIAGESWTPDSAETPDRQFVFNPDYTFSFLRADTLVDTGKYLLKEKNGDPIISYETENDNLLDQFVKLRGRDTLILRDECTDCYIHTYVRTK